ncbi:MAG: DUF99 family protein [Candidatus Thermoplasmatota archaeon]|nr:DUF99 family protein [Candidatus Thermoplasmatota archaeon]MBS3790693.1 DUF99 family protein [Candidatus Thermoplasmatota archaeon]
MAKEQVRAIGVDDAPFEFSQSNVLVIGSVVRAPNYLEGVLSTEVEVDGRNATKKLVKMISSSRFVDQTCVIFLDGAALGGFNLIDLKKLSRSTSIPSVTISREKPNFEKIKRALEGHFDRWEERFEMLKKGEIYEIETEHKPVYVEKEGIEIEEVKRLIDLFTVRGRLPEPLRMSHMVASGVVRGESQGKA